MSQFQDISYYFNIIFLCFWKIFFLLELQEGKILDKKEIDWKCPSRPFKKSGDGYNYIFMLVILFNVGMSPICIYILFRPRSSCDLNYYSWRKTQPLKSTHYLIRRNPTKYRNAQEQEALWGKYRGIMH